MTTAHLARLCACRNWLCAFGVAFGLLGCVTGGESGPDASCIDADGDGECIPNDCDDSDSSVHPGGCEGRIDGVDNNCNGVIDDCDCSDPSINPEAEEVCDGRDNDCDNLVDEGVTVPFYADSDHDGYGGSSTTISACEAPAGFVGIPGDCDDTAADVSPGATEVAGNGIDDDCDGAIDE